MQQITIWQVQFVASHFLLPHLVAGPPGMLPSVPTLCVEKGTEYMRGRIRMLQKGEGLFHCSA